MTISDASSSGNGPMRDTFINFTLLTFDTTNCKFGKFSLLHACLIMKKEQLNLIAYTEVHMLFLFFMISHTNLIQY